MESPESGAELTVLLLTWNEAEALSRILPRLKAALEALTPSHELLVVDAGSTDRTREVAASFGARVVVQGRRGYGNAYREGLAASRGRWILSMDADGSHPVEVLPELWRLREGCDAVIGSRYLPDSSDPRPFLRRFMSRVLNGAFRLALRVPLTDFSGALRLYRAEALRDVRSTARNFDVLAQILVELHARGGVIREVPYRYSDRVGGESKARLIRFSLCYARTLLACLAGPRQG